MSITKKSPNLLFIMCDQQRYDCIGFSNIRPVKTPNIDSIWCERVAVSLLYFLRHGVRKKAAFSTKRSVLKLYVLFTISQGVFRGRRQNVGNLDVHAVFYGNWFISVAELRHIVMEI